MWVWLRIACTLAFPLLSAVGIAQPHSTVHPTLEAFLCRAEKVFVGTISNVDEHGIDRKSFTLTIQVGEILKGDSNHSVSLRVDGFEGDKRWNEWSTNKTRFIFFVGPGNFESWQDLGSFTHPGQPSNEPVAWSMVRLDAPSVSEKVIVGQQGLPILSSDMTLLRTPQDVTGRSRAFIKLHPEKDDVVRVEVSGILPSDQSLTGLMGMTYAILPMRPNLEALGRRMVQHPESFPKSIETTSATNSLKSRCNFAILGGIEVLALFPSKANIEILRPLLKNTAVRGYTRPRVNGQEVNGWEYFIRKQAYEAMLKMGAKVPKPTIEAPPPLLKSTN